jgi:SAM-dependent methyltransferase
MENENTTYLAEHWRSLSQERRGGPHSALFWDRRAEGYSRNISGERREKRTAEVFGLINGTGLALDGAEVLDIGCGPGTLAIPLARLGAKVTAVDISAEMLKQLQKRAADEGLSLEKTILSPWSDIDLDALGFRGRFDLVLASMTPGINGPEAFDKMMEASKNVCYYSNFVSRKWDPSYYELYQLLFGEKFTEGGYGFSLPFMYLYTMGCRPTIKLSKNTWKRDETIDDMVETVSGFFSGSKDIGDEMKGRMREYFQERAKDGLYHSTSDTVTGMMVWRKSER